MTDKTSDPSTTPLTVLRLAAVGTALTVAMGSVVCATASGASCPTWPGCHPGDVVPGLHLDQLIEFTHRVVAVVTGPLVLAAAVMARRIPGHDRWVRVLPWVALVGAFGSAFFGRMVIVGHLSTPLGALDLFCALTSMTLTGVVAVRAGRAVRAARKARARAAGEADPAATATDHDDRPAGFPVAPERALARRLALASVAVLVAMHVSAIFAAGTGSYTRCMGWPLWRVVDGDLHAWLQYGRLGLAAVGAVLVVATAAATLRYEPLRAWGVVIAALFATEMLVGLDLRPGGFGIGMAALYSVTAVALLESLALFTAVAGTARVGGAVEGSRAPASV